MAKDKTLSEPVEPLKAREAKLLEEVEKLAKYSRPKGLQVVVGGYTAIPGVTMEFGFTNDDSESKVEEFLKGSSMESGSVPLDITGTITFDDDSHTKTNVSIPAGVTVVFGVTNSGKSELLKYIGSRLRLNIVRFQEPELPTLSNPVELIQEIERFLNSDERILLIDSFRFFVYNSVGRSAAGKGGVSTRLYSDLTSLSIAAAYRRKSIIVVLNPMSDDDSTALIAKSLEGSVSGIFEAKGFGAATYAARTLESRRSKINIHYAHEVQVTPEKNEMVVLEGGSDVAKSASAEDTKALWQRLIKSGSLHGTKANYK